MWMHYWVLKTGGTWSVDRELFYSGSLHKFQHIVITIIAALYLVCMNAIHFLGTYEIHCTTLKESFNADI